MITRQEYKARRQLLASKLPSASLALIAAANETIRNGDVNYRFRQDSNFYYLTGLNEPDAVLVIMAAPLTKSYLFNRPRNEKEERWTGKRLGQTDACAVLDLDAAYSLDELPTKLPELCAHVNAIYYNNISEYSPLQRMIFAALQHLQKIKPNNLSSIWDLTPILAEMRLFKSVAEINLLRQAAAISIAAHRRVMRYCQQATNEFHLEAEFLYELQRHGCRNVAYDPIIAAGSNACVLHYTDNNQPLKSGDLILVDAGAEVANYAADLTRTIPANGHFNKEQRAIYDLVLQAQTAGINCIKPGVSWHSIQETIVRILTEGLCELGLLTGNVAQLIVQEAYKLFYFHGSGHWLGLDVHDLGNYKINEKWRLLEPGMVLTVEPGLYISSAILGVDQRYANIGVRIEDDILVTQDGYENLSAALPKEIAEIEALM